jgi:hypothetical protein
MHKYTYRYRQPPPDTPPAPEQSLGQLDGGERKLMRSVSSRRRSCLPITGPTAARVLAAREAQNTNQSYSNGGDVPLREENSDFAVDDVVVGWVRAVDRPPPAEEAYSKTSGRTQA